MALITFLSDFGEQDHYVAAVKARILSINAGLRIIDISHKIRSFDLGHASYVLSSVFRDFPKGTVHLVAVDSAGASSRYLAIQLEDHIFVGPDNGIFGLISKQDSKIGVELMINKEEESSTFPSRHALASAAARLASNTDLHSLGKPMEGYQKMIPRHSRATKTQISGHIIHIDHYGNLITNILGDDFRAVEGGRSYSVIFGREKVHRISTGYRDSDDGDLAVVFNDLGFLEIAINKGNASELLGLTIDHPVNILFDS